MPIYNYEAVRRSASKSGPCAVCGKPAKRSQTFRNTVNPFNKNDDGTVRTRAEVAECVDALVRDWEAEPVMHAGCEAGR